MSITIRLKKTIFSNTNLPKVIPVTNDGFLLTDLFASYIFNRGLDSIDVNGPTLINNGSTIVTNGFSLDGVDDNLEMPTSPLTSATYILAYKSTRGDGSVSSDCLITNASGLGTGLRLQLSDDSRLRSWNYDTSVVNTPINEVVTDVNGEWNIAAISVDFATRKIKGSICNKGLFTETTMANALLAGNSTLTIGGSGGFGQFLLGEVACLLSYSSYMSDDDLTHNCNAIIAALPDITFAT